MKVINNQEYKNKTFSFTPQTLDLLAAISKHYGINSSSALRLAILEIARELNLISIGNQTN